VGHPKTFFVIGRYVATLSACVGHPPEGTSIDGGMMRIRLTCCALAFLALTASLFASDSPTNGKEAAERITSALESGNLSQLCVVHVSNYLQTRVRINQSSFRQLARAEFCVRRLAEGSELKSFAIALKELKSGVIVPAREVRWAVFLRDKSGNEISAIFMDSTGGYVEVGNLRIAVRGELMTAVKKIVKRAWN
jgi:hypothetical protein